MALKLLPVICLLQAALVLSQNNSPEDGGGPPTSTYTPKQHTDPVNNEGGASGSSGGYSLSHGGEVAIIVVVVLVALFGIGSAVLFYVAKKRQWEVRKTIKRASKRIVSRADRRQSRKGMVQMKSPPPSAKPVDLEKGNGATSTTVTNPKSKRQAMQIDDSNTKQTPDRKFNKTTLPDSWTVGGKK